MEDLIESHDAAATAGHQRYEIVPIERHGPGEVLDACATLAEAEALCSRYAWDHEYVVAIYDPEADLYDLGIGGFRAEAECWPPRPGVVVR